MNTTGDYRNRYLTNRYLWGPAVDQILAEEAHVKQGINNPTWNQPGTTFWPLVDHLGSVRDLAQVYGYPAGSGLPAQQTQLVKHREYDSYGNRLTEWNRADFNSDGRVDDADIDLLRDAINAGSTDLYYDLNGNGLVDRDPNSFNDMDEMILIILNTYYGDANLDGVFDSGDQTLVFQSGEYEDGIPNNSGWAKGDWNGDGDFDSADFTYVFNKGGYEQPNKEGGAYDVHQILLGFTARPFDGQTGLQNNLNRWYDPVAGRWLSEDPLGFIAGDSNLGRYVGNGPTSLIDPNGLQAARISAIDFNYAIDPSIENLYVTGFVFEWRMRFANVTPGSIGYQKVTTRIEGRDANGRVLHSLDAGLYDLTNTVDPANGQFFRDLQDARRFRTAVDQWVNGDRRVCTIYFKRTGDFRITNTVHVVLNDRARTVTNYNPAVHGTGQMLSWIIINSSINGWIKTAYGDIYPPGSRVSVNRDPSPFVRVRFWGPDAL